MSSLADVLAAGGYRQDRGEANLTRFVASDLDNRIARALKSDSTAPKNVGPELSAEHGDTLLGFARRAVVLGIREQDPRWIELAARALAAIPAGIDIRDAIWAVEVIAAATVDMGAPPTIMQAALEGAPLDVLGRFEDAVTRLSPRSDPWRDSLFAKVTTTWGVGLVGRGIAPYDPGADLLTVAMQVGDMLDADRYLADDPTIATSLPGIWLGSKGVGGDVEGLGCASIGAIDWDRSTRWDRMLRVWIIESRSERGAGKIARQAAGATGDHARLAVAQQFLACVIVARTTTIGVEPDETNDSLVRFERACIRAMRR